MSYIKTFDAYSFPNSIDPIANFISSFVQDKFDKWISRKNTANWKESFTFYPEDFDYKVTEDYPLEKLHLNLIIKVVEKTNDVSGTAYSFKNKKEMDPYAHTDYALSTIYRNKISPNIRIIIRVDDTSIEVERLKESIDEIVRHELLHTYQSYKLRKNNLDQESDIFVSKSISFIRDKYRMSYHFDILMMTIYFLITKSEFSAGMAELTSKKSPKDNPLLRFIREILSNSKEEYIEIVRYDLLDYYPKINFDKVAIEFVSNYEILCHMGKKKLSKRILKMKNYDFNKFIGCLYDLVKNKSRIVNKKFGKILNS